MSVHVNMSFLYLCKFLLTTVVVGTAVISGFNAAPTDAKGGLSVRSSEGGQLLETPKHRHADLSPAKRQQLRWFASRRFQSEPRKSTTTTTYHQQSTTTPQPPVHQSSSTADDSESAPPLLRRRCSSSDGRMPMYDINFTSDVDVPYDVRASLQELPQPQQKPTRASIVRELTPKLWHLLIDLVRVVGTMPQVVCGSPGGQFQFFVVNSELLAVVWSVATGRFLTGHDVGTELWALRQRDAMIRVDDWFCSQYSFNDTNPKILNYIRAGPGSTTVSQVSDAKLLAISHLQVSDLSVVGRSPLDTEARRLLELITYLMRNNRFQLIVTTLGESNAQHRRFDVTNRGRLMIAWDRLLGYTQPTIHLDKMFDYLQKVSHFKMFAMPHLRMLSGEFDQATLEQFGIEESAFGYHEEFVEALHVLCSGSPIYPGVDNIAENWTKFEERP